MRSSEVRRALGGEGEDPARLALNLRLTEIPTRELLEALIECLSGPLDRQVRKRRYTAG
jgi:hypothetical protein